MERIGIPAEKIKAAMSPECNMFEYLLVMNPGVIYKKGMDFVMVLLEGALKLQHDYTMLKSSVELLKQFFRYFEG